MRRVLPLLTIAAMLGWSAPAWAPFHLSVIQQVYFGSEDCPDSQFVMIRTLNAFQVFVNGQGVHTQTADGSAGPDFGTFDHNLSRTDSGVAMLIGTHAAAVQFGIAFDQEVDGRLIQPDGRVCFGVFPPGGPPVDCVAYGEFTGDNSPHGPPALAPVLGQALVRRSESDNNENDFRLGMPVPENNAGETGTLGACGGAAPTQTPTVTPVPGGECVGDCSGDGTVAINELITMVNIALGSSPASACPARCGGETVDISCIIRAVNNALSGCPAPRPTATGIPGGTTTATIPPSPTNTPGGPLGLRHFSLDPTRSELVATLGVGADFPTTGFTGFLDLAAGVPDPGSGVAFVDLVDASDYLSLALPLGGGAICLKVDRSQLPVHNSGILACKGGGMLGLGLTQDRNVGTVGACVAGPSEGLACASNDNCPQSTCFTAAACTAIGGTLEGDDDPFPGVCQGPLLGATLPGNTGVGALLLSPDPIAGITKGIPVAIIQEAALPCGDEPNATTMSTTIALTSGTARCTILDYNDQPGATLVAEQTGENFDCADWTHENGPGTLVLAAPALNTLAVNQQPTDIITSFVFVD